MSQRRMKQAARELADQLMALVAGQQLNGSSLQLAKEFIQYHRAKWKREGVDFPEMVVLPICDIHGSDFLEICRRDLEIDAIQTVVLNLTVKYPDITPSQIAFALRHAWPGMRRLDGLNMSPPPPTSLVI